jgi:hypothetical protein
VPRRAHRADADRQQRRQPVPHTARVTRIVDQRQPIQQPFGFDLTSIGPLTFTEANTRHGTTRRAGGKR